MRNPTNDSRSSDAPSATRLDAATTLRVACESARNACVKVCEGLKSLRGDCRDREKCSATLRFDETRGEREWCVRRRRFARQFTRLRCFAVFEKYSQSAARRREPRLSIVSQPGRTHAVCASVHMLAFRLTTIHSRCTRERARSLADASATLSIGNLNDLREIRRTSKHARVYPDGECGEIRFAPCCRRSTRRASGIPLPIQCDASVTGWTRPSCRAWTACIGRESTEQPCGPSWRRAASSARRHDARAAGVSDSGSRSSRRRWPCRAGRDPRRAWRTGPRSRHPAMR